jgi:hypothetical protein
MSMTYGQYSCQSSRPTGQLPYHQLPDQMLSDDGSSFTSSTSVQTPDSDSVELDTLEPNLRAFYLNNAVGRTTQVSSSAVPARRMFSTDLVAHSS